MAGRSRCGPSPAPAKAWAIDNNVETGGATERTLWKPETDHFRSEQRKEV
ncbi:hypothetical protein OESDEN_01473 [Oesophagostomum dentatum]|uniref:Uncharacterized protein n=1 Tax=Oesophagostomum dentatum TaxID=61180 RepID=A0A0B1TT17_OESDE|nr:hypothetical protein OESDEN_01473 [Oesophagostomum dentatum]